MVKSSPFPIKLEHLWCLTIIVGVFIFVNTHPIRPQDFWWHMAVGKEILQTRSIPVVDNFSYTMYGHPYPSYQMFWLMEVFLFAMYNLGGPALTVFIQSLIVTLTYAIIIYICYLLTGNWRVAAIGGIISAALGLNDWNVRPQTITFLLGSIVLWAIYSYRIKLKWKYLLAIPISMLIWVNSHGSFPLGLIIVGIWFVDELFNYLKSKRGRKNHIDGIAISLGTLMISCLVILINPRGIGIISYLSMMSSNSVVQNLVVEWAPPTLTSLHGILFFITLLLLAILMAISPRKPDLFEILTFIFFALLGISTSRGVIWFGLVTAPIFAQHINSFIRVNSTNYFANNPRESLLMNNIIVGCLLLLALLSLPWFKEYLPLPPEKAGLISRETPIKATEYLIQEGVPTQVFHAMSFGSYLIWTAHPTYKVFVDSRIELFPQEMWKDYLSISNAQDNWEKTLTQYGVNTLFLSPAEQAPLLQSLQESTQWMSVYKDATAEIFIKNEED